MSLQRQRERRRREMLRRRIAAEAARIMIREHIPERLTAVRRAAKQLGINDPDARPSDSDLDDALRDYRRLFENQLQRDVLNAQRRAAIDAMRFFSAWSPRLVGGLLDGTADAANPVQLQLFTEDPDAVLRFLIEQRIPFDTGSRHVRLDPRRSIDAPTIDFSADGIGFCLLLLPPAQLRQAPLDASGEHPMARASLSEVQALAGSGR